MNLRNAAILFGFAAVALPVYAADAAAPRPVAGKVEIMRLGEIKPGMKGTAWTVFQGTEAEPVPVEIVGLWKNAWGPRQDIILAKLGGKAIRTNVAGGMSGSPVYVGGKLVGAVALRLSVFSPDAICGITPIELMLEINDFDHSRPEDARTPDKLQARGREVSVPGEWLGPPVAGGASPMMVPIEAPLVFSGFTESTLRAFGPMFQQLGITAAQGGGAGTTLHTNQPAAGWEHSLNPGEAAAGGLGGRQPQPALPEQCEPARRDAGDGDGGPAAGAARGGHRERLGGDARGAGGRRGPGEGFSAAVSGRAAAARIQSEDSARPGQGRSPHFAERRRYREPHAEHGWNDEPVHRRGGDGLAAQPGTHQQQVVRLAGGIEPHGILRRQDAAEPAGFGAERDAGGAGGGPLAGLVAGGGDRAGAPAR